MRQDILNHLEIIARNTQTPIPTNQRICIEGIECERTHFGGWMLFTNYGEIYIGKGYISCISKELGINEEINQYHLLTEERHFQESTVNVFMAQFEFDDFKTIYDYMVYIDILYANQTASRSVK